MPVSKKRKTAATSEGQTGNSTTPALSATSASEPPDTMPTTFKDTTENAVEEDDSARLGAVDPEIADREQERQERFKALQARAVSLVRRDGFRIVLFKAFHHEY